METIALKRSEFGRPNPHVVIDARRGNARLLVANTSATLDIPSLGHQYVTDDPFAQHLDTAGNQPIRSTLSPLLHDDPMAASRIDQQAAFAKVVALRFLHINMFARFAGHDCDGRVPMVRRRDHNAIDGFVIQHAAEITNSLLSSDLLLDSPPLRPSGSHT